MAATLRIPVRQWEEFVPQRRTMAAHSVGRRGILRVVEAVAHRTEEAAALAVAALRTAVVVASAAVAAVAAAPTEAAVVVAVVDTTELRYRHRSW